MNEHSHTPNPDFGGPVDPERTRTLKKELEDLPGTLYDTGAVRYYLTKAIAATRKFERNHFLRRKAGAEQQARLEANALYQDASQRRAMEARAKFDRMAPPTATLENMYPRGGIIRWETDAQWDDFHVACRDAGRGDDAWRSISTQSLNSLDREMVLPVKYMNWGDSEPPYELCVMAVMDGIGTKKSNIVLYDDPERIAGTAPPAAKPVEPAPDTLTDAQRAAVAACDAEIEHFEEQANAGALEWIHRARNSVLGTSRDPFTRAEAVRIARGARRPEGHDMWTKVAAAL